MKQPNDSKRRMCYKAEEHIKHIAMECTTLVPSQYTNIQNKVTGYIHWTICKHMEIQITDKYYQHTPESVINAIGTTIIWDVPVITDRTILANRPDKSTA
jgi:adenylate kinase